jgi:pimeloyl-ACP methyl ester carboxylesterase
LTTGADSGHRPVLLPPGILSRIHCTALVIIGREDLQTPQDRGEEMADGIANGRFALIDHYGHLAPLEQMVATTAMMRLWLREG